MKKHLLGLTLIAIIFLFSCKKNNEEASAPSNLDIITSKNVAYNVTDQFVPGQLIVKFKSGTSEKSRTQTLDFINGKIAEHIVTNSMQAMGDKDGIYLVNTSTDVYSAIARVKGESNIEYAEPNWIYTHSAIATDTHFMNGNLWGMYGSSTTPSNQYGSQAAAAWANGNTGSATVYVGIIDEGAMFDHADLSGQFWNNPFDNPTDGIDNDNNGYTDDVHGWDFANNDNSTYDGTGDDHGTHVSGTIGAKSNGTGVVGVNWNITLISAKFLGANGGTTANAIKAVDYITDLKTRHGLNIVATNNSWGGGGFSQALADAITRAGAQNILFIAAAGNGNQGGRAINIDSKPSYPASYTNNNIISVAAIDKTGRVASFSNYGATSVDIGAPGVMIASTVPYTSGAATYAYYDGTSMATPHVTGAAALYAASHPGSTAAQIKAAILNSALPTSSLNGKCVTNGRLNVSGF